MPTVHSPPRRAARSAILLGMVIRAAALALLVWAAVGGSAGRPGGGPADRPAGNPRGVGDPRGGGGPAAAEAGVVYRLPLAGALQVVRGFDPPVTPYGRGHLGVDLRPAGGIAILAAADGVIRFAGPVAGRGVVVVLHADGISTEYEPVRPAVPTGAAVRGGEVIGYLSGRHPGCPGECLHWGARRATTYLDPLGLLGPLGPVVLLPWPGRPP